jgi:predicted transcriptional regulator
MRPAGEIRQALSQAARALAEERGAVTWKDMAEFAQVGRAMARDTVRNMERAGELVRMGTECTGGRPAVTYLPVTLACAIEREESPVRRVRGAGPSGWATFP